MWTFLDNLCQAMLQSLNSLRTLCTIEGTILVADGCKDMSEGRHGRDGIPYEEAVVIKHQHRHHHHQFLMPTI